MKRDGHKPGAVQAESERLATLHMRCICIAVGLESTRYAFRLCCIRRATRSKFAGVAVDSTRDLRGKNVTNESDEMRQCDRGALKKKDP